MVDGLTTSSQVLLHNAAGEHTLRVDRLLPAANPDSWALIHRLMVMDVFAAFSLDYFFWDNLFFKVCPVIQIFQCYFFEQRNFLHLFVRTNDCPLQLFCYLTLLLGLIKLCTLKPWPWRKKEIIRKNLLKIMGMY